MARDAVSSLEHQEGWRLLQLLRGIPHNGEKSAKGEQTPWLQDTVK